MKKTREILVIGLMSCAAAGAVAQTANPAYGPGYGQMPAANWQQPTPGWGRGSGFQGMRGDPAQRIEHRLQRIAVRLNLSEEQRTQIKGVLQEQHAKRTALRTETHERIAALLNEEQRAQFEQMRAQRGMGMGRRGPRQGFGRGPGQGAGWGPYAGPQNQ